MSQEPHRRGEIYNPERAKQLHDFSGMRFGKLTPTNIDGLQDFGDRLAVFYETKLTGEAMPKGQELALQRLTDGMVSDSSSFPREAIGLVAEHANRHGYIDLATCTVVKYRWKRQWRVPTAPLTVRQAVVRLLVMLGLIRYLETDSEYDSDDE